MSDENNGQTSNGQVQENRTSTQPSATQGETGGVSRTDESFSAADVQRILEADRAERTPAPDPIARFKSVTTKRTESTPTAQPSRVESLIEGLLALQVAAMKPPAPPAPIKSMSATEKMASVDPDVYLRRGPNAWTSSDTASLAADIAKARGVSIEEATAQARRQIVARTQEVAGNIKVNIVAGVDPFAALKGGR